MLVITTSEGGWITLGGFFRFQVKSVSGKKVKLAFDAPQWFRIIRTSLLTDEPEKRPLQICSEMTCKQLFDFIELQVELGHWSSKLTLEKAEEILPKINRVVAQAEQLMSEVKS